MEGKFKKLPFKKKARKNGDFFPEIKYPPVSSDEDNRPEIRGENLDVSFQRQIGKKLANRNKVKRHRERKEAARKIQDLRKKVDHYKKKYYRLVEKTNKPVNYEPTNPNLTPLTKVNLLLDASHIEPSKIGEVKRNLMFGEVIQQQLANSYQELKSDKKKQVFKKIVDGKIIKKYKMRTKLSRVMKFRKSSNFTDQDITKFERKKGKHIQRRKLIKQKIKDFLELEDNSRVCPGKKEFVKKIR